ncbi:MAG: ParB/RepB/Spo0J family partition protein [FCB group bacterium]|jgi:ParB family chromosome partitioning protein
MSKTKKIPTGLGKGLGALLPEIQFSDKGFSFTDESHEEFKGSIILVDVTKVQNNPYQPRRDFDKHALESLAESIKEHGVMQPIIVRKSVSGYELIAGERRLRASVLAGNKKIPAIITDIDPGTDSLVLALIENIQREDLNPIETAYGYRTLIEECHLTQEQVAAKVSKDRTTVTNFLRLLKLPDDIQESLRKKEITMGHARALLALEKPNSMLIVWKEIVHNGYTVRATENLIKDIETGKRVLGGETSGKKISDKNKKDGKSFVSPDIALVLEGSENDLRHIYGTKVKINTKSLESGSFEFEFYSKDDFERLFELFMSLNNE